MSKNIFKKIKDLNKKDKKANEQDFDQRRIFWELYAGVSFFSIGVTVLTFSSHLTANSTTVPVYAPKSGLYFEIYQHFGIFMHHLLLALANNIHNPFAIGWAVIIITAIYKFIMSPILLYLNSLSSRRHEMINAIKPQLDMLRKNMTYNPLNKVQREKLDKLKTKLYQENHIPRDPTIWYILTGIISSFITVPLYQGIAYSPELKNSIFFVFKLGERSITLGIATALISLLSSLLQYIGLTPELRKQTQFLMYLIGPISVFVTCWFFPSIIGLYMLTSEFVYLIRTILSWNIMRPMIHKKYKDFNVKTIITQSKINHVVNN